MTSSGYAAHIGRVGALAVALGASAAAASWSGVPLAHATGDGDSAPSDSASPNGPSAPHADTDPIKKAATAVGAIVSNVQAGAQNSVNGALSTAHQFAGAAKSATSQGQDVIATSLGRLAHRGAAATTTNTAQALSAGSNSTPTQNYVAPVANPIGASPTAFNTAAARLPNIPNLPAALQTLNFVPTTQTATLASRVFAPVVPEPVAAPITNVVATALALFGLGSNGPATPIGNPIADVLWAGFRRIESEFFNQSPTASPVATTPSTPLVFTGDLHASDPDGDPLTYTVASAPTDGTVEVHPDGTYTYTPHHPELATDDSFVVTVTEANADQHLHLLSSSSNPGSITVPVTVTGPPLNHAPVAPSPLPAPTTTNGVVTGSLGVTDPDGDPVTYTVPSTGPGAPTKGTVNVGSSGTYVYTPTAAAQHAAAATTGPDTDTFTVTASDNHGASTPVPVTVTITPTNQSPVAASPLPTPTTTNGVVTGNLGVTDPDGDTVTYTVPSTGTGAPTKGTVNVGSTGTYVYTPTAAAQHAAAATTGPDTDTFTVTTNDGHGGTGTVPVTVTITPTNQAPVAASPLPTPTTSNGVVTGNLGVTDPDGDTVTYTVPSTGTGAPTKGTVNVGSTGTYVYTPTAPATGTGPDTDSFTVTADDGHGGTAAVPVTVTIEPVAGTGTGTGPVVTPILASGTPVSGSPTGQPVVSADGSHAAQAVTKTDDSTGNSVTRVEIIDTTTGATKLSDPIPGSTTGPLVLSGDGKHAAQATQIQDPTTGDYATRVAVIDTTTGATTLSDPIPGNTSGNLLVSGDGKHALQATQVQDPTTGDYATRVAVIDTTTGATTLSDPIPGTTSGNLVLSGDGKHALQTTSIQDSTTGNATTRVALIDTATGATTLSDPIEGVPAGPIVLSGDGKYAAQTSQVYDSTTGSATTRLAVIDTTTGATTVTNPIPGSSSGAAVVFSSDGKHAAVETLVSGSSPADYATRVAIVDTTTGATAYADPVAGVPTGPVAFSSDGKHAAVTTLVPGATQTDYTTRVAIIDTTTGNTTVSGPIAGIPSGLQVAFSADGKRAAQTVVVPGATPSDYASQVVIVDATTGATTLSAPISGIPTGPAVFSSDGKHVIATVAVPGATQSDYTGRLAIIDATTGATTLSDPISGIPVGTPIVSSDGSQVSLISERIDTTAETVTLYRNVIDTTTGAVTSTQAAAPLSISTSSGTLASPDGTSALVTTNDDTAGTTQLTLIRITGTGFGTITTSTIPIVTGTPTKYALSKDGKLVVLTTYDDATDATTLTSIPFDDSTTTMV